ncbi:MAG: PadR family transcriptional regulator [Candidatus Hecatellaceae archaeon]
MGFKRALIGDGERMRFYVREVRERCIKSFLDVIIAYLLLVKPSWGYEIIARIYSKLHILLSPGVVYPLLHTMEKKGLVKKEKLERKEVYSLTPEGRRWLKQMLDASAYENVEFLHRYIQATAYENLENWEGQIVKGETLESLD